LVNPEDPYQVGRGQFTWEMERNSIEKSDALEPEVCLKGVSENDETAYEYGRTMDDMGMDYVPSNKMDMKHKWECFCQRLLDSAEYEKWGPCKIIP